MTANNTSSLLKNANFGENFEAKTGLNLEKKSPQTSKPACGVDFWRRGQDSNPRGHHCPNGFQDRRDKTRLDDFDGRCGQMAQAGKASVCKAFGVCGG